MNLRKIAVQFLIVLIFITAVPAAYSQQGNLRGPKSSTPRYPEQQQQTQPQTQRQTQSGTYGPIVSSDTLWQISQNYRPNRSLSIYQVMQAIYELNPDAFEQQNINLLKDGSILSMPSESYISSINRRQAQQKSELDSQRLQSNTSNPPAQQVINTATFDQTKELIEQRLGAIDEAQNRQFLAIRKQFGESISSVQSILDENKKLFERLGKVNTDIDEMRSDEQQKSLQMDQMGESIDELLEKSRQDDAERAAKMAEENTSWLDEPITLILLFTLPVLLILAAFAFWMIKRRGSTIVRPVEDDVDDLSLDPIAAEMDDLSDALSAELSGEGGNELDDDNLFGDDDLLDDVLAEELEESLDDVLEDSIEEPLVDASELFDELGDDVLEDKFEVGAEVVEQDDLDSLFDEDDDLLAEVDEEISAGANEDSADDLLAEVQGSDDNSDLDDRLNEEDKQQVDAEVDDVEYEEDESRLEPVEVDDETTTESVADDEEQPEISIDELLDESVDEVVENALIDDSDDINEDVLQNLDKEIVSQNEELDSVTGSLIDELEQVEKMRSMLPEDDEESYEVEEPQLGIQKLDDLAEEIDEDLLADDFSEEDIDDTVEVDISEVLNEKLQSVDSKESIEPKQAVEAEALVEPKPSVEAEASVEPEPAVEPAVEVEASVEPEPSDETEELVDDSIDEDHGVDTELSAEIEFEAPGDCDSTLNEDQLEKALEDFEKEELDEVLEDLTSNQTASISSLDDLEFSADDFVTKEQSSEPVSTPLSTLDDIESIDDFDDSELDNAFDEIVDDSSNESSKNSSDELDDLPGLGDWLDEDEVKPDEQQADAIENKGILEELEESSFDEMLESIDLDDEIAEEDDTGFDIGALLDETSQREDIDVSEQDLEDFLDVEALLNESVDAESDDEIDKALNLDIPLEPFVNEQDNLEMIDVDADDGLGAKLDLAHAYIEIGEEESAKELLDEILLKGSVEQIAEVKTILDKLG